MNTIYSIILSMILILPISGNTKSPSNKTTKITLTCYGNTPCIACKSCSYCKWCSTGGSCGICASANSKKSTIFSSKKQIKQPIQSPISGQCKALTKAGIRCKRPAKSNGYCWQHGG